MFLLISDCRTLLSCLKGRVSVSAGYANTNFTEFILTCSKISSVFFKIKKMVVLWTKTHSVHVIYTSPQCSYMSKLIKFLLFCHAYNNAQPTSYKTPLMNMSKIQKTNLNISVRILDHHVYSKIHKSLTKPVLYIYYNG